MIICSGRLSFSCVIFISCLIIHLQLISWVENVINDSYTAIALSFLQGVVYMLYPFCGWLSEVRSNQFNVLKWSFAPLVVASGSMAVVGITLLNGGNGSSVNTVKTICFIIFVIGSITGSGMFEANAIQFGMDQMLDASSEQLSSFVHWYFWCTNVGPLLTFYIGAGIFFAIGTNACISTIEYRHKHHIIYGVALLVLSTIQIFVHIFGFFFLHWSKKHLHSEQSSRNSLKFVHKVLIYSFKHKYPERRSAFTYWENDIPSRVDLGKEKYGGPFTYEQVEDVKTFFRLLLLILSLFGFHLLGNGQSLILYTIETAGCPPLLLLWITFINPQHIPFLVVLISIPLFEWLKTKLSCYIPTMLSRLWIGLYVALIAETVQVICVIFLTPVTPQGEPECTVGTKLSHSLVEHCLLKNNVGIQTNSSCTPCSDGTNNDFVMYITFPVFLLYGISYLLVFMTTLEFICAQSPNSMKGLLIGIWYSTLSFNYLFVNTLDKYFLNTLSWSIYNCCKGFCIFLSVAIFSHVAKTYCYREKNEVVNEQNIIEEQYQRELLLNESITNSEDD